MKKKQQKSNKWPLIFISIFVLVIVVAILIKIFYVPMKTYHSKFLKIMIDYPAKYDLEEWFGTIMLKSNKGEIVVDSIGTNFEDLNSYLQDLSEKNKLVITDKTITIIDNKSTLLATLNGYKKSERVYFLYPNKWIVYSISTSNSLLYSDLDLIAHSFRYEP